MVAHSLLPALAARGRRKTVLYPSLVIAVLFASFSMGVFTSSHRAREVAKFAGSSQQNERGVVPPAQITLLSPATGSLIAEARPIFRWKLSSRPAGAQKVFYRLSIVELRQGQTLEEALRKNPPVLERRDLAQDSFQLPASGALITGKAYAWRVTAFEPNGKEAAGSGGSFFGVGTWPNWTFCALLMYAPSFNYCIGSMPGLTVAFALMTGTGSYFWTLTQTSGSGSYGGSSSSGSPTIFIPPTFLPTMPGTYTFTLTVTRATSSGTCTQTANLTIVVDVQPVAGTITVTPAKPLYCPGEDAVLTLNGQSVPGFIQWYSASSLNTLFSNPIVGAFGNTTQNTNPLPSATTYFGVQVSSPNGACPPAYASVQLNVQPPHGPVTISGPSVLCVGASGTLNVVSGGAGCTNFQWYCDGLPCGSNSPSITVTDPGNYSVECSDNCGTVMSNVITIQPDLLAVSISGLCCPCKGQKIQLCANPVNGTPPYNYQWSANAGGGQTQCKLVIPVVTTTYSVTVTDANGCQATNSFTATVCP
jgi:hypothetical protein